MADKLISVDEYLGKRAFSASGDRVLKASASPPSWSPATRTARFVMSSERPDRDKDIVRQDGLDTSEFVKNPVAPLFHMSRSFAVGQWSGLAPGSAGGVKSTEGDLTLLPAGADPDADRVATHIELGTIRTVSIGFLPKTIRQREKDPDDYWPGYEILEATLLECSVCLIPSQPDALIKSAGHDHAMARELLEEILDTWAKTPTGLILPRAEFEAAWKVRKRKDPAGKTAPAGEAPPEAAAPAGEPDGDVEAVLVVEPAVEAEIEAAAAAADEAAKGFAAQISDIVKGLFRVRPAAPAALAAAEPPTEDEIAAQKALAHAALQRAANLAA